MDTLQSHHALRAVQKPRRISGREPISWTRLLATTALFSIVTGAILVSLDSRHPATVAAANVETSAIQSPLGLKVTIRKQQMEIRWDHDSVAVLKPSKGLMKITEGESTKLIPMDWRDLQDGSVSYAPLTNDIKVRLDVTGADGALVTESARAISIP
jgi:hypothetical protein